MSWFLVLMVLLGGVAVGVGLGLLIFSAEPPRPNFKGTRNGNPGREKP